MTGVCEVKKVLMDIQKQPIDMILNVLNALVEKMDQSQSSVNELEESSTSADSSEADSSAADSSAELSKSMETSSKDGRHSEDSTKDNSNNNEAETENPKDKSTRSENSDTEREIREIIKGAKYGRLSLEGLHIPDCIKMVPGRLEEIRSSLKFVDKTQSWLGLNVLFNRIC